MESMQTQLGRSLEALLIEKPYCDISIKLICEGVPTSRRTFYNYFHVKDELVEWIIKKDFMENTFPIIKSGMGLKGVRSFFKYIKDKPEFYNRLHEIDEGMFLFKYLTQAYDLAVENVTEYARPVKSKGKKINPSIYNLYTHAGIAAIVVDWIGNGMELDIDEIARDTGLMMENPLSFVRDHYLL